ncbi:uncharacterized protein LOC144650624 [Oculina patagonica]
MTTEFDADTVSAPRLVVMKRGPGGYGFNLHGERNVQAGQTISAVDDGSEAQKAGLRVGDKVVEVNGLNVEKMSHGDVVKRIKMNEKEVSMLVIDHITDAYLKQEGRPITTDMANLMTVYQPKEAPSEPEPVQPAVVVVDSVPEVQESSAVESTPTPTIETSEHITTVEVTNNSANEVDAGEVANEATTPEEVKQLNEVLDKEEAKAEEPAPAAPPAYNGTESHEPPVQAAPEPTPAPAPAPTPAPAPAPSPAQNAPMQKPVAKPTSKPLRSTIKQQKAESWDDKYKKFQQL